jgi:hypothetical protein
MGGSSIWSFVLAGAIASAHASALRDDLPPSLVGQATVFKADTKSTSESTAYKEVHELVHQDGKTLEVKTDYFDPSGKKIAEMRTDLRRSRYLPAYRYRDLRHGIENGIEYLADGKIRIFRLDPKRKQNDEKRLKPTPEMVAGQGVFFFLHDRAPEMAKEKSPLTVQFLVPSRLGSYPFRVRAMASSAPDLIPFRVEFKNWFFRLFAPFIEVDFDSKAGRLVEYRGASNVHDELRQIQSVRIRYQYDSRVLNQGP